MPPHASRVRPSSANSNLSIGLAGYAMVLVASGTAACGGGSTEPPDAIVAQVVVTPAADTLLALNDTRQYTAVAKDTRGNPLAGKAFTWSSTAEAVATVSAAGLVTAVGNGGATIRAQVDGVLGSAGVVVAQEVSSVTVTPASDTLVTISDTTRFAAQARDANGNTVTGVRFLWLSSDPAIASVDTAGLVTARTRGAVTIMAAGRGVPGYAALLVKYIRYQAVTVGAYHACGLGDDGKAYCWGRNGQGQVGNGQSGTNHSVPNAVLGGLAFKALAAGGWQGSDTSHTCGITTAGAAYCWGDNTRGQLGDGSTTGRTQPAAVLGGITFASITAGAQHTCALTAAGEAYCWGANNYSQLGDGGTSQRNQPWPVSGSIAFSQISAGSRHACGVTASNVAYCWGYNPNGQVGDNSTTGRTVPTPVSGGLALAQISAGWLHTCARGTSSPGALYCWGGNGAGQLGDGTTASDSVPGVVLAISGRSVQVGDFHTCAVASHYDGYCWGGGPALGDGGFVNRTWPGAVVGGLKFTQVDGGVASSCGLVQSTGEIYCWGSNTYGQLGALNSGGGSAIPLRIAEPSP